MKMVFVVYYMTFGGIERQITQLANEMSHRGHDVSVVSLVKNNTCYPISEQVNYMHIEERGKAKIAILNRYLNLRKYLKKVKPDITVNFMLQSAYFCAFMKKKYTGTVLYSERGFPNAYFYSLSLRFVRYLAMKRIDKFVFQTEGAQKCFSLDIQKRSMVIPNPVFIKKDEYKRPLSPQKVIMNIGRLSIQKNHKLLIEAFQKVSENYPDYILKIYGEGELEEELSCLIKDRHLSDRIKLMGTTNDIYARLLEAELFVLSSDFEGIPNVLIEAMALGIPCISTDCEPGGARELISHGVDGIIVERDSKNELAKAICKMLDDKEMANELGRNAAINIQRYAPEIIYDKWETFLVNR